MSITSERDRLTTFLVPPGQDGRMQRYPGVDLQCPARLGRRSQRVPELVFKCPWVERASLRLRPGADRVVDMGKHREEIALVDKIDDIRQILSNNLGRDPARVQKPRLGPSLAVGERVQRA